MPKWVEAATTDPASSPTGSPHVRDHGVGLAMGRQPDGRMIFALDVDEHDSAHSGVETLADLQAEHGNLPETWCSITGSGGLHCCSPPDVEVRNGKAGDGLDIRGEGGQIVVAPSVHPGTGGVYDWEHGFAPWERDIAAAPEWLLDIVLASQRRRPPLHRVRHPPRRRAFADPDTPAPSGCGRSGTGRCNFATPDGSSTTRSATATFTGPDPAKTLKEAIVGHPAPARRAVRRVLHRRLGDRAAPRWARQPRRVGVRHPVRLLRGELARRRHRPSRPGAAADDGPGDC